MEAGEAGKSTGDPSRRVAAATKLLRLGWWSLDQDEKNELSTLIRAGLKVGVNPNFERLGLNPALVTAHTNGRESLWDIAGEDSHSYRSYYSSSLHTLTLAAPPIGAREYADFWKSKEREGVLSDTATYPLREIRFLMSPVEAFDDAARLFDFRWDTLPRREAERRERAERVAGPSPGAIAVVNRLMENPIVESLGEVSAATHVRLDEVVAASRSLLEFPIGWGYRGAESNQVGMILLYEGLREGAFGPLRACIRGVPYTALEAWGTDPMGRGRYVYFAELVLPTEALAEATSYVNKVSASCADCLTHGFYEPLYLEQHSL